MGKGRGSTLQSCVCIVALCGAPCAGKSSICEHLAAQSGPVRSLRVLHVSFDAIYAQQFGKYQYPHAWHSARLSFLSALRQRARDARQAEAAGSRCKWLILADDTNHLGSLRKEIFRIAVDEHTYYASLFVPVRKETMLQRLATRATLAGPPVSEDSALRIATALEDPCRDNFASVTLDDSFMKREYNILETVECIFRRCQAAETPWSRQDVGRQRNELAAASRSATNASVAHHRDLALRAVVRACGAALAQVSKDSRATCMAHIQSQRRSFLHETDARDGDTCCGDERTNARMLAVLRNAAQSVSAGHDPGIEPFIRFCAATVSDALARGPSAPYCDHGRG